MKGSLSYWMGNWRPEIGDPSIMGWFTVASYFACAGVACLAAVRNRKRDDKAFALWVTIAILMAVLGINKQLDLQSLLTEIGRQIARAQGWFEMRRTVQFWFIALFGAIILTVYIWYIITFKSMIRRSWLAFCGLFFLMSFIVIRAVSFHHVDELIQYELGGVRMNWMFELSGIYMILFAGVRAACESEVNKR
jgi:magnesium-transporting ATPase (P-type)